MNKKRYFILGAIICLMAVIIFAISKRPSDLKIEQIKTEIVDYTRDEYCPLSCKMISAEVDGTAYFVQEGAYSEEDARSIICEVASAVQTIQSEKNLAGNAENNSLKIFVLDNVKEPTEHSLIITRDSFYSKDYRYDLFQKLTGYDRGNKSYGLCSYIFGDTSDEEETKAFISDSDTKSFFDMFFLRGDSDIVGDESARQYLQMVSSLSAYLIDTKGIDRFIADSVTSEDIEGWLLSMGIDAEMDKNDICSLDDVLVLDDPFYDVHIRLDRFDMIADNYASLNTTVDEVASLLKLTRDFDKRAEEYLHSEGAASDTVEWPVNITLSTIGGSNHISNCITRDDGVIAITLNYIAYATLAHEITHGYAGNISEDKRWMNEGIAQYFSYIKFVSPELRNSFFEILTSDTTDVKTREYYLSVKDVPISPEEVDIKTCMDAYIIQYWDGDEDLTNRAMFSDPIYSVYNTKARYEGDELSYCEAMSFIAYLIDRFSFNITWDCMINNKSYVEAFGLPYKKLKDDWIESVYNP